MRNRTRLAVIAGGLSLVACDNPLQHSSLPTAPSAALSGNVSSGPSQADHTLPPDGSFDVFNPCTGQPTTLTEHYLKFVYHENMDETGGVHFTLTGVIETTTVDGFSGRETFWMGGNFGPGHSDIEEQTGTLSNTLGNGSGQRIVVHFLVHIVFKDGVPVVVRDGPPSVECRGKPVA